MWWSRRFRQGQTAYPSMGEIGRKCGGAGGFAKAKRPTPPWEKLDLNVVEQTVSPKGQTACPALGEIGLKVWSRRFRQDQTACPAMGEIGLKVWSRRFRQGQTACPAMGEIGLKVWSSRFRPLQPNFASTFKSLYTS